MAAASRRALWKSESDNSQKWREGDGVFSQEMLTIIGFTELITTDFIRVLDLTGREIGFIIVNNNIKI